MSSLVARLHDAAVTPEAWPDALTDAAGVAGVAGAALIIFNKSTGKVDEARSAALALDSSPITSGTTLPWTRIRHCSMEAGKSSPSVFRTGCYEAANGTTIFILTCGVRDILGTRLVDTSGHCVIFGIHQQIGRSFSESVDSVVNLAGIPLKQAAWRHIERLSSPRSAIFDLSQTEVSAGSRFYFHIDNGSRYPDETGSVFSTADDAMAHAIVVARELAQDGSWHGSSILVTDDRGHEIVHVRIGR
jgi:hypothetical protein